MPTGHEGTGEHGHKDTREPWPHTKDQRSARGRDDSGRSGGSEHRSDGSSQQASSREERESLERREYRDANGEVHHHTRTYQEQHKGDRH